MENNSNLNNIKKYLPILAISIAGIIIIFAALIILGVIKIKRPEEITVQDGEVVFDFNKSDTSETWGRINAERYQISKEMEKDLRFDGRNIEVYLLDKIDATDLGLIADKFGFLESDRAPNLYQWSNGKSILSFSVDMQILSFYSQNGFSADLLDLRGDKEEISKQILVDTLGLNEDNWSIGVVSSIEGDVVQARFLINGEEVFQSPESKNFAEFTFDGSGNLRSFYIAMLKVQERKVAASIRSNNVSSILQDDRYFKSIVRRPALILEDKNPLQDFGEVNSGVATDVDPTELTLESSSRVLYYFPNNRFVVESMLLETDTIEGEKHYVVLPLLDSGFTRIR